MKLTFLGATHEVTGSCFYLEACDKKILIDYGMEQGVDYFENKPVPVPADQIDMVFLTHAHIDHSGKLPLLVKEGFHGQIFATEGTEKLCSIMLQDSAHIQESEAEYKTRKSVRAGGKEAEPLYTVEDALNTMRCFVGVPYDKTVRVDSGITVRFFDAGHLLGSASIEVTVTEGDVTKKLLFSGDIGNTDQPLLRDPVMPKEADYVIMEATYGTRFHEKPADYTTELAKVLQETFDRGGNVVIPSFAVGRTQEILYFIRQIKEKNMVTGHDGFEVWVDSPLAIEATGVFLDRMYEDLDEEVEELLHRGVNPISFNGLRTAVTADESKAINDDPDPKVIISASGMCEAGRIRHHLKHNLWRPQSTVLFVGYQSVGTLGRALTEGADKVKLFGEEIAVEAQILVLQGISGHADCAGLLAWAGALERRPEKVFVVHSEDQTGIEFCGKLKENFGYDADAPYSGTEFDLAEGRYLLEAEPVRLKSKKEEEAKEGGAAAKESAYKAELTMGAYTDGAPIAPVSAVYVHLVRAASRLMRLVERYTDGGSADLKKFTREVNDLCERWERK